MGTNYTQLGCEDRAMIHWGLAKAGPNGQLPVGLIVAQARSAGNYGAMAGVIERISHCPSGVRARFQAITQLRRGRVAHAVRNPRVFHLNN